jgi:AhpD family alkylhydroperoxidase
MPFNDTLIKDHLEKTHSTELLSEREKHMIGMAVTMTRGCQPCTKSRIQKARNIGISDDEINALIAITAAVNSGVTGKTASVAFEMLESEEAADSCKTC